MAEAARSADVDTDAAAVTPQTSATRDAMHSNPLMRAPLQDADCESLLAKDFTPEQARALKAYMRASGGVSQSDNASYESIKVAFGRLSEAPTSKTTSHVSVNHENMRCTAQSPQVLTKCVAPCYDQIGIKLPCTV
jgi:hypothetical protein